MASWGGASTCGTRGTIAIGTRPAAPRKAAGSLPPRMPRRRTKRGGERTPLAGDYDAIVCGASFGGLAVAREMAGAARVLLLDRYEIGERQTSACAAPTAWLEALGLEASIRQTFDKLVMHTPHSTVRFPLPWTFSTFDYPQLCRLLDDQNDADFETAKVEGRGPGGGEVIEVHTDRGTVAAPLVVDALGWRRILGGRGYQPPDAPLSRGLEVHPHGSSDELEIWVDRAIVPAGYGWSFPARDEVRIGVGSFDPRFHVKDPTVDLTRQLQRDPVRYQGNWIPHRLRPATVEDDVFFAGRLRGSLPAADGGGHPDRALLRHRARARAAGGGRGAHDAGDRPAPLRRLLRRARVEVPLDAARAARRATSAATAARAGEPRDGDTQVHPLGVRPLPRGGAPRRSCRPHPSHQSRCSTPRWRPERRRLIDLLRPRG